MIGVKPIPIDPQAIRYAYAAGVTNFTHKRGLDAIVKGLAPSGILAKITALYPMLGVTQSMSKLNFINPIDKDEAFRLSFIAYPTMSYRGVDWNGSTQYANTFLNPLSTIGVPSSLAYYSRDNTNTATDEVDMGCGDGATSFWVSCYYNASGFTSSLSRNCSNSVLLTGTNVSSAAFYVTSKTSTTAALYRNRTQLTTASDSAALPNNTIYIGCLHASGNPLLFTNRQCAFSAVLLGVSSTEEIMLYNAVQIYQIILWGRQV